MTASHPELVVHIGAGKTGSTSIQFTLRRNAEGLAAQNAAYFGLMLEQIPGALGHDWCQDGTPVNFFRTPPAERDRVADEVCHVVLDEMRRLKARGVTHAVWSNEAFLSRADRMLPILQNLAAAGVPIRLICYVRRHDKWARSAYVQFGLKGKSYPGPLRDFNAWVQDWTRGFAADIQTWDSAFPGQLRLYNFDAVGDVVRHFCSLIAVSGIDTVRANETPSNALLSAWAVFNSQDAKPVRPEAFNRMATRLRVLGPQQSTVPALDQLLPTADDLVATQAMFRSDFATINALLAQQNQPPLIFDRPDETPRQAAAWEIDRLMFQMIFSLQNQVLALQDEVRALKDPDRPA